MKLSSDIRMRFLYGAWAGLLSVSSLNHAAPIPAKPNIIFILVDDLGKEWFPSYGAMGIQTPSIDSLASEGMRFKNFYSNPICSPTRVELFTGQYPFHSGWIGHYDVPRFTDSTNPKFDSKYYMTFARVLKSVGYATAAAGKWQINDFRDEPDAMVKHGFDEYAMWTGAESGSAAHTALSDNRYFDPYIHTKDGSRTYTGQFGDDIFSDFLIDFINRNRTNPFMVYYPMCLTHTPFTTTPLMTNNGATDHAKHVAMVKYVDFTVAKIRKSIKDLGIEDNTYLFLTTDNGTVPTITGNLSGATVQGAKNTFDDAGVNEPFIVWAPGRVPAGTVTNALGDMTDMFPTFAELAGINQDTLRNHYPLDGVSLVDVITGIDTVGPKNWILAMGDANYQIIDSGLVHGPTFSARIIRDKNFKVWVGVDGRISKLFNMNNDPAESNNLVNSSNVNAMAAKNRFQTIVDSMPNRDGRLMYDGALLSFTPTIVQDLRPGTTSTRTAGLKSLEGVRIGHTSKGLHLSLELMNPSPVEISVSDLRGKNLIRIRLGSLTAGKKSVDLALPRHVSGLYSLQINSHNARWAQKVILP